MVPFEASGCTSKAYEPPRAGRDRVATFVTAETVEVSAIGVDVEGGSLLVVKGAETLVAATRAFQGDEATDEVDQVDAVTKLLDCLIGNSAQLLLPISAPSFSFS